MNNWHYIKEYIKFQFIAKHHKGHGVHSPYVFSFIEDILNEKNEYYIYKDIESARRNLLADNSTIFVNDYGTGASRRRKVSEIARTSLKCKKESQMLFRFVCLMQPKNILELGTSLGITTLYLAKARTSASIYTIEGCPNIAKIAKQNFKNLGAQNITSSVGNIDTELPKILSEIESLDMVFFDANHTKEATLNYFNHCLPKVNNNTVFIFDDIYWSEGMTQAWKEIYNNPAVTYSIDLFHLGIVFFNKEWKKSHFKIKF
jgi:predicted O-methyltransferase YrrM